MSNAHLAIINTYLVYLHFAKNYGTRSGQASKWNAIHWICLVRRAVFFPCYRIVRITSVRPSPVALLLLLTVLQYMQVESDQSIAEDSSEHQKGRKNYQGWDSPSSLGATQSKHGQGGTYIGRENSQNNYSNFLATYRVILHQQLIARVRLNQTNF